jgi:hypothetical protein
MAEERCRRAATQRRFRENALAFIRLAAGRVATFVRGDDLVTVLGARVRRGLEADEQRRLARHVELTVRQLVVTGVEPAALNSDDAERYDEDGENARAKSEARLHRGTASYQKPAH